jgi:hypothetical protein
VATSVYLLVAGAEATAAYEWDLEKKNELNDQKDRVSEQPLPLFASCLEGSGTCTAWFVFS